MSSNQLWRDFREQVGDNTMNVSAEYLPMMFTFGLSTRLCEVFDVTKKDLLNGKRFDEERIDKMGNVLWYIAALEDFYDISPSRYTNYFDLPMEMSDLDFNLIELHSEALIYAGDISLAVTTGDVDEIQYNLNKLMGVIFDVCLSYSINVMDPLQRIIARVNGNNIPQTAGKMIDPLKQYKEDYKSAKKDIVLNGKEEILLQLKVTTKQGKMFYKSIEVKAFGEVLSFTSKDIIVDFFDASNKIAEKYKDKKYQINYDPKFRELLTASQDTLFSGFIIGETLISASALRDSLEGKNGKGNIIKGGNEARPILMTPKMKVLNHLLDYVNTFREKNLEKK